MSSKSILEEYESLKNKFLDEYKQNGFNAVEAASKFGIHKRRGQRWVEKELGKNYKNKALNASMQHAWPLPVVEKPVITLPTFMASNETEIEFMAEFDACDGDVILASSRVGIDVAQANKIILGRIKKLEFEATKRKNQLPQQSLAKVLPKEIITKSGAKHIVIPDVQVKPGQDFTFLRKQGEYIASKMPDVIIAIGDFADMPSLSTYDKGKKSAEGKRYAEDIRATKLAMETLMAPIKKKMRETGWAPKLVLTLGNHEHRISRAADLAPEFFGHISVDDLGYEDHGWMVYPFLEVVKIDGVCYSHYFTTGAMGRPSGSARQLLTKKHCSCVQGHIQKDEQSYDYTADGKLITVLFVGTNYEHDEDYLTSQGNYYFRGIWVLHEVNDGAFNPVKVPLSYTNKKFK